MGPKNTPNAHVASDLDIHLDTKSYSNVCKRLTAHLQEKHGFVLTHTQVRTAMAEALGFDSPNYLDSLLRANEGKAKGTKQSEQSLEAAQADDTTADAAQGASGEHAGNADALGQAARIRREVVLRERLTDLIDADPTGVAVDLGNLSLSIFAKKFPPVLTSKDKKLIKENYPNATNALIAERAMSSEGLTYALALNIQFTKIALDYSPESHVKSVVASDQAVGEKVSALLQPKLQSAFNDAVSAGMSPFGVATMMILIGAITGVRKGVKWLAMVRPLVEAVEVISRPGLAPPSKEAEDRAMSKLMEQMGISRAEAKRYLKMAKESGNFG